MSTPAAASPPGAEYAHGPAGRMFDGHELRTAIRRSWLLILAVTVVCTSAAAAYSHGLEPRYRSQTQLFVAAAEQDFGVARAPSYAALVTSPNVTAPVVQNLGLHVTPGELADRLSASAPAGTVLINLAAWDHDPGRAQRIAAEVAVKLIALVTRLERPSAQHAVRVDVSSPASYPTQPASGDRLRIVGGAFLGLFLGLLAAITQRLLDRRIRTPDDLTRWTGHDVLSAVPREKSGGRASSLYDLGPGRVEALRKLRASVSFFVSDTERRSVVVTSSLPGEGTSATAVGLAMALAEAGSHVILVEANLHRPQLTDVLGLPANAGVAGHLSGGIAVEELLQRVLGTAAGGGLHALTAGAALASPAELLSSPRLPDMLAALEARCDVVVIDAPPLLCATESAVLAGAAEGVLLVVAMGRSTAPELERALDMLGQARARVFGLVANCVSSAQSDQRDQYSSDHGPPGAAPAPPQRHTKPPAPTEHAAAATSPSMTPTVDEERVAEPAAPGRRRLRRMARRRASPHTGVNEPP